MLTFTSQLMLDIGKFMELIPMKDINFNDIFMFSPLSLQSSNDEY